jgi:4a-hydroxytetrahydrobiopterin dehydratase
MSIFKDRHCVPCTEGTAPLKGEALLNFYQHLPPGWAVVQEHHLEKEYPFKNFRDALAFVNKIGDIAEKEGHHPDIFLSWGKVKLTIWTHKIQGLTESDFILAAKCDV